MLLIFLRSENIEFKFVNGDQGYESEYVPDEVRVGYDFDDNRWMYVDSLSNDTSFIGAVQFGLSSPANKFAIRYKVDMTNVSLTANGVHTSTNYNAFSLLKMPCLLLQQTHQQTYMK